MPSKCNGIFQNDESAKEFKERNTCNKYYQPIFMTQFVHDTSIICKAYSIVNSKFDAPNYVVIKICVLELYIPSFYAACFVYHTNTHDYQQQFKAKKKQNFFTKVLNFFKLSLKN